MLTGEPADDPQAAVGLAVGGFADRAIARGVPVARLRKGLQTVGRNGRDLVVEKNRNAKWMWVTLW